VDDPTRRFIALYDAHYRRVLGYVLLRAEPAAAQDVVSETFLIAWRRLGDVPETALPWLLGVARNLLRRDRDMGRRDQSLARRIAALAAWLRAAIKPKPDPQTPAASDPEPGFGPPAADELLFATAAELLAMQYIPRDPARFGVRVPAGTATLSVTTVESGWVDTLGQRP
jgi:DNA-directed RNA polymerase specialized sigma24 family protein